MTQIDCTHTQALEVLLDKPMPSEASGNNKGGIHTVSIQAFAQDPNAYIRQDTPTILNFGDNERCGECKEISVFESSLATLDRVNYYFVEVPYTNQPEFPGWKVFKDTIVSRYPEGVISHIPAILYCVSGECCELDLYPKREAQDATLAPDQSEEDPWKVPMTIEGKSNVYYTQAMLDDARKSGERLGSFIGGLQSILRPPISRYKNDTGTIVDRAPTVVSRFTEKDEVAALKKLAVESCRSFDPSGAIWYTSFMGQ